MTRLSPAHVGLGTTALVLIVDQLSKWWIRAVVMNPPHRIELLPVFNIVLVENRGASFGMFGNAPEWMTPVLVGFALLIAGALLIWMRFARSHLLTGALGLVAGGAIGNAIDRIWNRAVIDFLDFHIGDWHWPAFNGADSAITIGVALLIIDSLKSDGGRS